MKVLITGSNSLNPCGSALDFVFENCGLANGKVKAESVLEVVTRGSLIGADKMACEWAELKNLKRKCENQIVIQEILPDDREIPTYLRYLRFLAGYADALILVHDQLDPHLLFLRREFLKKGKNVFELSLTKLSGSV